MLPSGGTEGQESDDLTFLLLEQNRIDLMICGFIQIPSGELGVNFSERAVNSDLE